MGVFIYVAIPVATCAIGCLSSNYIKNGAYYLGLGVSKWCQKIPFWDTHIEPLIIKGTGKVFTFTNSFLHGMASDNADPLTEEFEDFEESVQADLEYPNKKK